MSHRKTTIEFVTESQSKFGDNYDYLETIYTANNSKVAIRCNYHNEIFLQTPSNHLIGFEGCKICFADKQRQLFQKQKQTFIEDAIEIHGSKYDYTKTLYINNHTKVEIECPHHGTFFALPVNHLKGVDCQKCGYGKLLGGYYNSFFDRYPHAKDKDAILYFVQFNVRNLLQSSDIFYKVGITSQTIEKRFAAPVYRSFEIVSIWQWHNTLYNCFIEENRIKKEKRAARCTLTIHRGILV